MVITMRRVNKVWNRQRGAFDIRDLLILILSGIQSLLLPAHINRRMVSFATVVFLALTLHSTLALSSQSLLDGDDPLSPEDAFVASVPSVGTGSIDIHFDIADGYYLYKDKLSFSLQDGLQAVGPTEASEFQVLKAAFAESQTISDEYFGEQSVFRDETNITLPYLSTTDLENVVLAINFQGCADMGLCYPPTTTLLNVSLQASTQPATQTVVPSDNELQLLPEQSEQDRLFDFLGQNSLWFNVVTFFGLGLLLSFTPCVLPMIPILSSMIVGQGESMNTGKAFRLSLVYVLVMASTYAIVGVAVGLSGYNVQAFLQNPWVLSAIAGIFVLLSLSMFGFYEMQMPTAVQTRLTQWSSKQGGGQVSGVAAMGFLSTLIVGPCVTAPLAGALIYIAKTGDALIGGVALFSLGLGMGAPLLLIGTSAGKLVPKAGAWMNTTKQVFGILMLVMAVYMVSRVLPSAVTMFLYAILAIMSGVYWGATDTLDQKSSGWRRFSKGTGLIVTVYGLALLVGGLAGGESYGTPLKSVMFAQSSKNESFEQGLAFQPIKGIKGLEYAVQQTRAANQPVMLDFYADWCISCKEMDALTFSDPVVQALLKDSLVIQADVTANDIEDQALLKEFDLFGPPGIIFYNSEGEEIPAARLIGYMPAGKFAEHLKRYIQPTNI